MERIRIKRFGLAFGLTGLLLYIACILVMLLLDRETTIAFFNRLLHGLDVRSVLRTEMPAWEMIVGAIEMFILAWLTGATIAAIYNVGAKHS